MRRTLELRPKNRTSCDLASCRKVLKHDMRYPTLSEGGRYFAGVRVFCTVDHLDEYETRLVLAKTKPHREDRLPGVKVPPGGPVMKLRSDSATDGLDEQ